MSSAVTSTPPSYALAAGAKPSSRRTSSTTKDEADSTALPSSSSTVSPSKDDHAAAPSSVDASADSHATEPLVNGKQSDAADKTASASDATASSATANGSSSASSSSASSTSADSASSVDTAANAAKNASATSKPNLTPAPPPKVNVWKVKADAAPPKTLAIGGESDPSLAELTVAGEKKSKSASTDLDSKSWPAGPDDEDKKDSASKGAKRQGKEKWVPYTPAIIGQPKSSRNGKPFSSRTNNSNNNGGRSGSTSNDANAADDSNSSRGNKNLARGNKQKSAGAANNSSEKRPANNSSGNAPFDKDKQYHKKHEKKDVAAAKDKEESSTKAERVASKEAEPSSNSTTASASQAQSPAAASAATESQQSPESSAPATERASESSPSAPSAAGQPFYPHHNANQQHFASGQHQSAKGVPANGKAVRPQRSFAHTNGQGINRPPREFYNGNHAINGQQASSSAPTAPQGQYVKPTHSASGTRNHSPRASHANPQFTQPHYGYQQQQQHGNNNHHNGGSYQLRRSSAANVAPFQPVGRQFYAPQQDYGAAAAAAVIFGYPTFPAPVMPGYPYDPVSMVVQQIEFYFSLDNLLRDMFLRRNMNSKGLVPLSVLAGFNRLKNLTGGDLNVLVEACRQAPNVELVGQKVRSIHYWQQFVLSPDQRTDAGREEEDESTPSPMHESPAPAAAVAAGSE
ncbi:hypothetical protein BZA70DRAFT_55290 [Myxozyma melibiosi]|uniref:HTH La-type RNA-binding domain-containing protein n=1 Tax=Myxozyma melibiosi TaxID=54550 RepID=A0ABR1FFH8_9ASCO